MIYKEKMAMEVLLSFFFLNVFERFLWIRLHWLDMLCLSDHCDKLIIKKNDLKVAVDYYRGVCIFERSTMMIHDV